MYMGLEDEKCTLGVLQTIELYSHFKIWLKSLFCGIHFTLIVNHCEPLCVKKLQCHSVNSCN